MFVKQDLAVADARQRQFHQILVGAQVSVDLRIDHVQKLFFRRCSEGNKVG